MIARITRKFCSKAVLPKLNYEYHELAPVISQNLLEFHHKKHHQTYVNNYNAAMEKLKNTQCPYEVAQLQKQVSFNAGGHINHSIYWTNLSPVNQDGGKIPSSGVLYDLVIKNFGSFEKCFELLTAKSVGVQGSGWGWLAFDPQTRSLRICETANQDLLENVTGCKPLLTIDVWEHAYYLDYQNLRPNYAKEMFKIINWKNVESRLQQAMN